LGTLWGLPKCEKGVEKCRIRSEKGRKVRKVPNHRRKWEDPRNGLSKGIPPPPPPNFCIRFLFVHAYTIPGFTILRVVPPHPGPDPDSASRPGFTPCPQYGIYRGSRISISGQLPTSGRVPSTSDRRLFFPYGPHTLGRATRPYKPPFPPTFTHLPLPARTGVIETFVLDTFIVSIDINSRAYFGAALGALGYMSTRA